MQTQDALVDPIEIKVTASTILYNAPNPKTLQLFELSEAKARGLRYTSSTDVVIASVSNVLEGENGLNARKRECGYGQVVRDAQAILLEREPTHGLDTIVFDPENGKYENLAFVGHTGRMDNPYFTTTSRIQSWTRFSDYLGMIVAVDIHGAEWYIYF